MENTNTGAALPPNPTRHQVVQRVIRDWLVYDVKHAGPISDTLIERLARQTINIAENRPSYCSGRGGEKCIGRGTCPEEYSCDD